MIYLIILGIVVLIATANQMKHEASAVKCKVHKWEYVNNNLACSVCRKTPEQLIAETR